MVAHATPLQPLTPEDKRLLRLYFELNQNTQSLADELIRLEAIQRLSPNSALSPQHSALPDEFDLAAWSTSQTIAPYIAHRKSELAENRREEALNELSTVVKHSDSPIERRRAATTLLRDLSNQLHRSRTKSPQKTERAQSEPSGASRRSITIQDNSSPDSELATHHSDPLPASTAKPAPQDSTPLPSPSPVHLLTPSPVHPPPTIADAFSTGDLQTPPDAPLPSPTRTHEQLVKLALFALQHPDDPTPTAAHLNLFNLHGILDRTTAAFHHFKTNYLNSIAAAWNFRRAEPAPINQTPEGLETTIPITLKNDLPRRLYIKLRFLRSGPLAGCWIIEHIICMDPPRNTS